MPDRSALALQLTDAITAARAAVHHAGDRAFRTYGLSHRARSVAARRAARAAPRRSGDRGPAGLEHRAGRAPAPGVQAPTRGKADRRGALVFHIRLSTVMLKNPVGPEKESI